MQKKKILILKFNKEKDGKWYFDFPHWPFAHHNLMMVAGADKLCEKLSESKNTLQVLVCTNIRNIDYAQCDFVLTKTDSSLFEGAFYNIRNDKDVGIDEIWLCPVTLFALGRYPKVVLIKRI